MRLHASWPLLLVLAVLSGCGSPEPEYGSAAVATAASAYASDVMLARLAASSRAPSPWRSLDELLGNVAFRTDGGPARPLTDLAVVGPVVAVDEGYGFVPIERGVAPAGKVVGDGAEVAFHDPRALWRTLHLRVRVEEVLSGDAKPGQEIEVGMSLGDAKHVDAARFAQGMRDLGRAVWFLTDHSPAFAYDRKLFADLEDGSLITPIDADGRLSTPFADAGGGAGALTKTPTLASLRSAALEPERVLELHTTRDGFAQRG